MLVHKRTMAVLHRRWTGQYTRWNGVLLPVMAAYTLDDVPDPTDWWVVPDASALARRLLAHYPFCDPIIGDGGELVDVVLWPKWKVYGEPAPAEELPVRPVKRRGGRIKPLI